MSRIFNSFLIVEDHNIDTFILRWAIDQNLTIDKIICCVDGSEALSTLKNIAEQNGVLPDLIFLDYYMSPMDGIKFLEHLSHDTDLSFLLARTVMLTCSIDERIKQQADILGVTLFLKPATPKLISEIITSIFGEPVPTNSLNKAEF
jgi:CheY-like chemotaxis protein